MLNIVPLPADVLAYPGSANWKTWLMPVPSRRMTDLDVVFDNFGKSRGKTHLA